MDISGVINQNLQNISQNLSALQSNAITDPLNNFDALLSNAISAIQSNSTINNQENNSQSSTNASADSSDVETANDAKTTDNLNSAASSSAPYTGSVNSSSNQQVASSGSNANKYDNIINAAAKKYNVDSNLIKSIIQQESDFNPNVTSSAGAAGLMQLMPDTASNLNVSNVYDPVQNINGGTDYLKQMIDEFKDVKLAIAAYNAGPGCVKKYNGVPPYAETTDYVNKVINNYSNYSNK